MSGISDKSVGWASVGWYAARCCLGALCQSHARSLVALPLRVPRWCLGGCWQNIYNDRKCNRSAAFIFDVDQNTVHTKVQLDVELISSACWIWYPLRSFKHQLFWGAASLCLGIEVGNRIWPWWTSSVFETQYNKPPRAIMMRRKRMVIGLIDCLIDVFISWLTQITAWIHLG